MAGPSTVEEYLSQVPREARATLERIRTAVKAAAPDTTEMISYQMPTFKYRGRALLGIAAFKNHCSVFLYSGKVLSSLEEELQPYDTSGRGTIRFTTDEPLPDALIRKIVKTRIEEIEAHKP
jgi:uncharacterized protein YdhG (YjbR/CyaY superfamily)